LGGKGASVIFADADLNKAAESAARAAFRNQGEICLAGSRLIVEESVAETVINKILQYAAAIRIGDPQNENTTMGALISEEHRNRVAGFVDKAKASEKIKILCGGKIPAQLSKGFYYEPTVITGVTQDSVLIKNEIFGPVLTVQTFKTQAEAIELTNGTEYGLSSSVWTRDIERAKQMARAIRTGMVWINCWYLRELHTAFGGMKRSGVGREGGQYSLDFFSEFKTITTV